MPIGEEEVLSFVRSSIRSAWTLELLLLLRRDPERRWTVEALVRELRGSLALVTDSLTSLRNSELVGRSETDAYFYAPETHDMDDLVSALVELYASKPIAVLKTIFTSPSDKIRSFSDAFLLRRSEKP